MSVLHDFWEALPKLPADSFHAIWAVFLILTLIPLFYGLRLGEKAVKEGRAEKFMGMVLNTTIMREMFREARSGSKLARAMLWLQFLTLAALLLVFVWPRQPLN